MIRKPLPTWSDFTDAELDRLIGFLVDDVEFATCARDRYAADRQRVALDRLHMAANELNRRRGVEQERCATIRFWSSHNLAFL